MRGEKFHVCMKKAPARGGAGAGGIVSERHGGRSLRGILERGEDSSLRSE
jgi:hypothetical protein